MLRKNLWVWLSVLLIAVAGVAGALDVPYHKVPASRLTRVSVVEMNTGRYAIYPQQEPQNYQFIQTLVRWVDTARFAGFIENHSTPRIVRQPAHRAQLVFTLGQAQYIWIAPMEQCVSHDGGKTGTCTFVPDEVSYVSTLTSRAEILDSPKLFHWLTGNWQQSGSPSWHG